MSSHPSPAARSLDSVQCFDSRVSVECYVKTLFGNGSCRAPRSRDDVLHRLQNILLLAVGTAKCVDAHESPQTLPPRVERLGVELPRWPQVLKNSPEGGLGFSWPSGALLKAR